MNRVAVCLFLLFVISCQEPLIPKTKEGIKPKVVVVVIDGLCYTELDSLTLIPEHIFPEGVFFNNLWIDGCINKTEGCAKTNTVNGHAAMACGKYMIPFLINDGSEHTPFPTIFEKLIKDKGIEREKVIVSGGKARLISICWSTDSSYGEPYGASDSTCKETDRETYERLQNILQVNRPHLWLNNFHEVDDVAHLAPEGFLGWMDYIRAVKTADTLVCQFYEDLKRLPDYKNMIFMLVTDHGRHSDDWHGHGCTCIGCRHIFACIIGPDIRKGTVCEERYEQPQLGVFIAEHYEVDLKSPFSSIAREDLYITP